MRCGCPRTEVSMSVLTIGATYRHSINGTKSKLLPGGCNDRENTVEIMPYAPVPLPLGIDDFKKLRMSGYYFVDKSLLIKDIIDFGFEVHLILRPRRFGKTLHLSMLKYFFDREYKGQSLFSGLAISQAGERYRACQGRHPVIFLSLKNIRASTFDGALEKIKILLAETYEPFEFLLQHEALSAHDKADFLKIRSKNVSQSELEASLKALSRYLFTVTGEQVIILIDEYDAPVHHALQQDYKDPMLDFLREFFGAALKSNVHLKFGVVTGILRIAKENLFSGLNNLNVYSMLDHNLSQHFAWSEQEVEEILTTYDLVETKEKVREWYDGYIVGKNTKLYNPWSILKFIADGGERFKPFWVNTGNPELIKRVLARSDHSVKSDLALLLNDQTIHRPIADDLTLSLLEQHADALWHLLLFSGYLTALPPRSATIQSYDLKIPNKEVRMAFHQMVHHWFSESVSPAFLSDMARMLVAQDISAFKMQFSRHIEQVLSYFDVSGREPERFYHAFVLGLLVQLSGQYCIRSNRESGFGRYDVLLLPNDHCQAAFIFEFKVASDDNPSTLEQTARLGLEQIQQKHYSAELLAQGFKTIWTLSLAFHGKKVHIANELFSSTRAILA